MQSTLKEDKRLLIFDERLLKVRRINQVIVPVYENEKEEENIIGYLYSDTDTYRQAVTLMVRFEGQLDALIGMLKITKGNMEYINFLADKLPLPFKMFAPYLGLIVDSEPLEMDMENLIKHLHIIGRTISFSEFITVPVDARINVAFTRTAFLMMDQEVADYKTGLYESERAETPDGVMWMSSEEVSRVGQMYSAMIEAFGGSVGNSRGSYSSTIDVPVTDATDELLAQELQQLEEEFDPDEWAGYVPPVVESNWDNLGIGKDQPFLDSKKEDEKVAASVQSEQTVDEEETDEEEDVADLLASFAAGTQRVGEMI